MLNLRRNRINARRWSATDFESFEVLVSIGARRPAALVNQARAARPVRRAWRTALRTVRRRDLSPAPGLAPGAVN